MMELINRYQAVVERLNAQLLHCKAEGCMGTDKDLVLACEELPNSLDLGLSHARLISSRRIA